MLLAILLVPVLAGLLAFILHSATQQRALLLLTAVIHAALTGAVWRRAPAALLDGWIALDPVGRLVLTLTSTLFLACAVYSVGYLRQEAQTGVRPDFQERFTFANAPDARFVGAMALFLAAMSVVAMAQHLGLLWVAIEATTLASAPLIFFHRHRRSLEALWKYVIVCSVGIALALLGNYAFSIASQTLDGVPLLVPALAAHAADLSRPWLRAGFIFLLVGYGTKMGLAPMHTWLPDAHSEAPSVVSALLSGALLNCAFLGIWRGYLVLAAAGDREFAGDLLILLGLLSLGIAAIFLVRQADFKRMLAYSSVEHMGLLAIGIGVGGAGISGAFLHAVNHSLTKAALFLVAGNILTRFQTKSTDQVRGVLDEMPVSGALWVAGVLAITGLPPFGVFISKLAILKATFDGGATAIGVAMLVALAMVFIGMTATALRMAQGASAHPTAAGQRETVWSVTPPLVLLLATAVLGLYVPGALTRIFTTAATLGGN